MTLILRARTLLLSNLLSLAAFLNPVWAQPAPPQQSVLLSEELELSFVPEDVFFLVREEGQGSMRRVNGVFLGLPAKPGEKVQRVMAAARVPRAASGSLEYSVLAVGKASQVEMTPPRKEDLLSRPAYLETPEALYEEISARREVLNSYRLQIQTQEDSLRRLRQDAEVIGNFGRVNEVSDEVERLRAESAVIDQSTSNLESLIKLASTNQGARGSVAREGMLTRQIAELADASKQAEAGEISRKAGMEKELRAKLEVVESTRFDDLEALQRELEALKAERAKRGGEAPAASPSAAALPVSPETEY